MKEGTVNSIMKFAGAATALAFTGQSPLTDATQLALALAGIILLGAGIPITIAMRKRARREQ